jgi:parallel beta-helix repeat protein
VHCLFKSGNCLRKRMNGLLLNVLILFLSSIFIESEAYSQCSTLTPSAPSGLTLAVTSPVSSTPTSPSNGTDSSLVGYWKFDEGTGSTACDSSGKGNNGTLINGPLRAIGKIGGGLYFDGIDDNVTVADSNSLDVTSSFTLSAWVNPASTSTDFRSILVKNYKYYLYASAAGYCGTGNPLAGFDEQTTNAVCQPAPLPANTWTHLAATYTGSILTLYLNGVAVATSNFSKTLSPSTGTLQIGASQFGENFKGLIDEVRVHNRGLTTTEIQALFQQDSAVRESGLVAHWKFDEGSGTAASDSSGSGNAGALTNGPLWTDGRIGKGLFFDGVDDHVRVADSNSLDVSSSFTLSAWVNPASSFTDFRSILVKNYKYYLYGSVAGYCGSGNPLAGFDEQTSNNVCQSSPLAANTWTHLAATYTGSILTLYRNGVAVATSNIARSLSPSTGTLQIGASEFGENFKGLIDEVRVHNRALTNSEIQSTFQQESGGIFNFSLLSSGDKSVVAGSSVTNSIAAALVSGTNQSISFSTTGVPSGATASFSTASCTLACSTVLTINTTGSTPAGSFPITVTSTGGGVTRTTAFTLSVTLALIVAAPTTTPDSGTVAAGAASSTQNTSGNTYYVATNGNDSNSGTISNPFRSIAKGISVLRGGDTLYIRGGTYLERMRWPVGGTSAAPTFISNYQSEIVTIRPSGEGAMIGGVTTANQWTVFNGLILDGVNADQNSVGFGICCGVDSRITFQNGEVKNFPGGGIDVFAHNNRILNTKIHHNAVATSYGPPHGMYITGYGNLFERLEVYNNGYYGIHIYNSGDNSVSDNVVRNSSIHDNGLQCTGYGCGGYGIIVSSGSNNQVYSNLIYSNGSAGFGGGIQVNYRCLNCKIYSNTLYNNYGYGIDIDQSSTGVIVRNNISTNNRATDINNQASGTIISNNMTTDPLFLNPSGNDFRLKSGSGAIDRGIDLSSIGITTDVSGVNRPQGSAFDIGAYEYVP